MREAVLHSIRSRRLLRAGDRVAVAVSGGADSVALLRVLLALRSELGIVLAVAHFNHGLRDEAAADEAFVAEVASELALDFFSGRGEVREHALTNKLSIEAAARELRYQWLKELAAQQRFDVIATAHTRDDQAETVLLKFLRGAGTRGLAGIYPVVQTGDQGAIRIVRPLLDVSRDDVEAFLTSIGQQWREDESNLDRRFTRNRVRHELLPLVEREYNPNIRSALSDASQMFRDEEEYWRHKVEREFSQRSFAANEPGVLDSSQVPLNGVSPPAGTGRLDLKGFAELPVAFQRRLLKRFAQSEGITLDFHHTEQLRRCALEQLPQTELPGGSLALQVKGMLELRQPVAPPAPSYRYILPLPGEVRIAELGLILRAELVREEFARENTEADLLNPELLGGELLIRNWLPGDRFWPAHRGSEEKLKRLFAEKHIPAEQRPSWPLALHQAEIVWVRGFSVARAYQWAGTGDALVIEALPDGTLSA